MIWVVINWNPLVAAWLKSWLKFFATSWWNRSYIECFVVKEIINVFLNKGWTIYEVILHHKNNIIKTKCQTSFMFSHCHKINYSYLRNLDICWVLDIIFFRKLKIFVLVPKSCCALWIEVLLIPITYVSINSCYISVIKKGSHLHFYSSLRGYFSKVWWVLFENTFLIFLLRIHVLDMVLIYLNIYGTSYMLYWELAKIFSKTNVQITLLFS